jgi:haloacetate dehalogenase
MWHKIAPRLAREFTVVAADLRGSKPADGENHSNYSKRDVALDHPDRITKLAVLDIVPTYTLLDSVNNEIATAIYHWFSLVQPSPFPETLIANNVEFYLRYMMFRHMSRREIPTWMGENAFVEYLRCFRDAATIHANCEDYRAGASIDMKHDEEDLKRNILCPVLTLWGERGALHRMFDTLAVWRERAANVSGKPLPGRHFLPEEIPDETLPALRTFLNS